MPLFDDEATYKLNALIDATAENGRQVMETNRTVQEMGRRIDELGEYMLKLAHIVEDTHQIIRDHKSDSDAHDN